VKPDMNAGSKMHDYFKTINNETAYWAGYIAADGNIHSYHGGAGKILQFVVKIDDKPHLETFKQCIGCKNKIHEYDRLTSYSNGITKRYAHLNICKIKEIANDLDRIYNITEQKSNTLLPPTKLDGDLSLSYIKGIIDGDGTIRVNKSDNLNHRRPRMTLEIAGTKPLLIWISKILGMIVDDKKERVYYDKANKGSYRYIITGFKAEVILDRLHKVNTPEMMRKWNVVINESTYGNCDRY
jgi:hypothetical protein